MILAVFTASLLTAVIGAVLLIPLLHRAEITGKDMHKQGKPAIAEMGGLAIVVGTGVGISVALAMMSFFHVLQDANVVLLLAALVVILVTGIDRDCRRSAWGV